MYKSSYRRCGTLAWVLALLLAAAGCISPAVHKNVPAFASAVTLATENTKSAFETVEQTYEDIQAERIVVNYDMLGFHPKMVNRFLDLEDLQVRLTLLDALRRYASALADVSGDEKLDQFDDKTRALGSSLQSLTAKPAFQKFIASSARDANIAATAVNALGRWFIERKRQKRLPQLIDEMQDPVQRIAELLEADIGSAPDERGQGGHGLRDQLWNEHTQALLQQMAFIDHNKDRLDPASKAIEIRKLPAIVRQRSLADQTFKQTQATLSELVDAHAALLRATKAKADVSTEFSVLLSEAQRIKSFYNSLQKKD